MFDFLFHSRRIDTLERHIRFLEESLAEVKIAVCEVSLHQVEHIHDVYHLSLNDDGKLIPVKPELSIEDDLEMRLIRDALTKARDNLRPPSQGSNPTG